MISVVIVVWMLAPVGRGDVSPSKKPMGVSTRMRQHSTKAPVVRASVRPDWNQMNVPEHSAWAKNVLLIVVWMFVAAVLVGPLVKYTENRKPDPPRPNGESW